MAPLTRWISLSKLQELVMGREVWVAAVHGGHNRLNWQYFVWRISRHWVNNTFPFPWWSWLILCFHKNKTCFYCRCTHSKEKLRSHTQCTTALKKKPSLKSLFSNTPGCCPWHSPGKNTRVGCHPSPGEPPNLGIRSPALQILLFFTAWATREALIGWKSILIFASLFQG